MSQPQLPVNDQVHLDSFVRAIEERGWASTSPLITEAEVDRFRSVVAPLAIDGRGGARNLLDSDPVRDLACSRIVRRFASAVLGDECFAVRALLFDKTPDANWKVIWHQDLTVAAREIADVAGYGPWTEKAGVPHVQPPSQVLENMLAIRIHLDPCGIDNGPVRVIDGSHRMGRLSAEAIDALRQSATEVDCLVAEGGVLAFRPLLLHASAPSTAPSHRRVIHIEFASVELASPLEWHRRIA